jgi:hypothetical protein
MKYEMIGIGTQTGIYYIEKLEIVYFPENNTTVKYVGASGFSLNSNLHTIYNLPDSIVSIGQRGFASNSNLVLTKLPKDLKYLADRAFVNNSNLAISNIPLGVTTLYDSAFSGCPKITIQYFGNNGEMELSALENNLETFGTTVFAGSGSSVDKIYIGSSIKSLEKDSLVTYGKNDGRISIVNYSSFLTDENKSEYFPNHTEFINMEA